MAINGLIFFKFMPVDCNKTITSHIFMRKIIILFHITVVSRIPSYVSQQKFLKNFLSQAYSQVACFQPLSVGLNLLCYFSGFLATSSSGSPESYKHPPPPPTIVVATFVSRIPSNVRSPHNCTWNFCI